MRPLAVATDAHTILEVGSESGLSSRVLLNYVANAGGHLYSIDTQPGFDTKALQAEFPHSVTFIQGMSLDVIPDLPTLDLVLLDGDHNWFTVYHELHELERVHRDAVMPVIALHDSDWPYGRRDLYYDPETVPAQYRHPYSPAGLPLPDAKVAREGGINQGMNNGIQEGGDRNGVMTAIEDYLGESPHQWKVLHLPMYFGVTILIPEARLQARPQLREYADWLEKQLHGSDLIALAERLRLAETIQAQALHEELRSARARISELEAQLAATLQAAPE